MSALLAADSTSCYEEETPARFAIPRLPRHLIRRDRLNCLLSASMQNQLAIVTGPPGSGKTVLLADWSREYSDGHPAWLTLHEGDDDPETFWRRVGAALDAGHAVLVLDDFHRITNPAILTGVAGLIRALPSRVRVVLVGHHVQGSALKRLLLRGEIAALGETDLRFTVEEVTALTAMVSGKHLPLEAVTALTDRCEGWAAGLHLAATALSDEDDPSSYAANFTGASPPVADYLEQEMLLYRPPGLVRFFLQTSVLDDLTPDLCRAVSGRSEAGAILKSLADRNLFVVPLGAANRFRYHRLFVDLLRDRLEHQDGSLAREAHCKAGAWFEKTGDLRAAARHYAMAGAYERAFRLAFPSNALVATDDDAWPSPATDSAHPVADDGAYDAGRMYVLAAALLAAERASEALAFIRRLEAATADARDASLWKARVEYLWAVQSDRVGDRSGSLDHCRAAEELFRSASKQAPGVGRETEWQHSWIDAIDATISDQLPLLAARAHAWLGQADKADAILSGRFGSRDRAVAAESSTFAVMSCRQGRLGEAHWYAGQTLRLEREDADTTNPRALEARLALAEVLFERNELRDAETNLDLARALCTSTGRAEWTWTVDVDLLQVMVAQQRHREALSRLWQLRRTEGRVAPPADLVRRLNDVEVVSRIRLGDLAGVLLLARSTPSRELSPETLARIDLFAGRPDRVLTRLRLVPSTSLATEIRRLLLFGCADAQRGDTLRAEERVRRAVDCGRPEGYVRPFLEEAPLTLPVLRGILGSGGDPYLAHLIFQAEQLVPERAASSSSVLLEPLTERERELLTYLATHLHLREIAARMYVSHNTVKTHAKAIYRKVGAQSRGEAVTIARAHGLL